MQRKVLAVASGGGHWVQLLRLTPAFEDMDVVFVGVRSDYCEDVPGRRFYVIDNATRWDRLKLLLLAVKLFKIVLNERPQVLITTGSAPGLIALVLARVLVRAKTIWVDSIANCEHMSLSGLQASRFAHVWLTQWPQLEQEGGPYYWGSVL